MSERNAADKLPDSNLSPGDIYDAMEPFEPYTTTEVGNRFNTSQGLAWSLLNKLVDAEKVRKKGPEPNLRIWIREPSAYECPDCGREFQVKYLHRTPSHVQVCPQCGTQLRE